MLDSLKNSWKATVIKAVNKLYGLNETDINMTNPPKSEMGDIAFPLFPFSKSARKAPQIIASEVMNEILSSEHPEGEMNTAGAYLNVALNIHSIYLPLLEKVRTEGFLYGRGENLNGKKIMLEFSCPNTNKPLHLGHMRNDSLGEAVSRILKANGAEVMKVNLINNRGVHICKSMLAYKIFSNGETPSSTGEKGDHFVGRYYVKFASWQKEMEEKAEKLRNEGHSQEADEIMKNSPEVQAQAMLRAWEEGDEETIKLWKLMNEWTLDGLYESYENMGISFDRYYYESDTYKYGKAEILKGLEDGVFFRAEDGSVQIDLKEIGLDKKVLLRKDGTTIYITQDVGTAIRRHEDWPFDRLIYVVASEQQYHFKALFYILKKLGYSWADELYHLSYGMVNLPEGKMKSREGTVVDADDLLESLSALAKEEIISKDRESAVGDVDSVARKIALAALNYYLLQVSPTKDMIFDPKKSISFNGNTGPYLEYMGARISSILRKAETISALKDAEIKPDLLASDDEKSLIKLVSQYPSVVKEAGDEYDPSVIAAYIYEVAKTFSHYYHDNQVADASNIPLSAARLSLVEMILTVMKNAFELLGIPFLESM